MTLADKLRKVKRKKFKLRPEVLMCPNVPKPMHGVAPRVVLGTKWWNKTRQDAYKSTGYHCLACGVSKYAALFHQWLEGHELYKIDYAKGIMRYLETVPLCNACHNYIHDGRLTALKDKGIITHGRFAAVIQHGDRVLKAAGLRRPTIAEREAAITDLVLTGKLCEWSKWRLVIGRKRFKPKFKTPEQWRLAFE